MITKEVDLLIVGGGPVGLMCAHLANLSGLTSLVIEKSPSPLQVGRADALNARTLQFMQVAGLFDHLYPLGKTCNTSSVWTNGKFVSRQSSWWDELEGCLHKHFLMIGQAHLEQHLDQLLHKSGTVLRSTQVENIELDDLGALSTLSTGDIIRSRFVIGADGGRSFVRNHFNIGFEIERPQIIWAVIDGVLETNFPKVPEIIVFQQETSDVAWIPREGAIDRFYVRMDTHDFTVDDAIKKIQAAVSPHSLNFASIQWFSQFAVKESVAQKFSIQNKVFLAGDAAHIHSVNGGQGLNTGIADAFNLIWKLKLAIQQPNNSHLLKSYEEERRPVALSVIASSGELVRSTKYSEEGTHALDYVKIVEKRAGNITGMGIRYGEEEKRGERLFDMEVIHEGEVRSLYSLLEYGHAHLLVFTDSAPEFKVPEHVKVIRVKPKKSSIYDGLLVLVRPDTYVEAIRRSALQFSDFECRF